MRDLGGEEHLAGGDRAHRVDHFLQLAVLGEEAGRAGPQRLGAERVLVVHGEDEDLRRRAVRRDAAGGLDAVEHGHRHVHQDDVGAERLGEHDGLVAVARLTHDVDPGVLEGAAHRLTEHLVVVGEQHAGHDVASSSMSTVVPDPRVLSNLTRAPIASARSRMPDETVTLRVGS